MKRRLLKSTFAACCLCGIVACKPAEPPPPVISSEIGVVEEKIRKFKAEPSAQNKDEVDKALANLNAKIKELEVRQTKLKGSEKDETAEKVAALRMQYNLYTVDVAAVKVQAATGHALEKAGDAVKDAASSVSESLKSDKTNE